MITQWKKRINDPRRVKAVQMRTKVEKGIRDFFLSKGFLETRTPLLVPCPGMEPHIRPFKVETVDRSHPECSYYLPTSPEFAMKRLLVGGLPKIFQICSSFRDEPHSVTHRPEFTMLEWYRAQTPSNSSPVTAMDEAIMQDTEELFEALALQIFGKPYLNYQGKQISFKTPWPRLKVRNLFLQFAGIDLGAPDSYETLAKKCKEIGVSSTHSWDDLYFAIWLNLIEPQLPSDQAVFVTRYPASQAALSVIDQDPDGTSWARRFEIYAGGLELGNAFEELTDPVEQRKRFVKDMELRTQVYGKTFPPSPLDEEFLHALSEGLPPSGGIAVGVDRMVMLFADEPDIDYTFWI